jgi:TonB family protein
LSELACDDAVLRRGVPAQDYAMHLLEVARTCRPSSMPVAAAVPMARASTLERRIAAMLNPRIDREAPSPRAIALIVAGLLGLAVPTSAIRAAQDGPLPLTGSVYDPTGAVVPDAALTLEDAQHHTMRATTDSQGRFTFAPVAPGSYVLSVTLRGFSPLKEETELRVARDWDRAITLQVGVLQESVWIEQKRTGGSPPAATGPAPIRVGGNIRPPKKIHHQQAVYPQSMIAAGVEGKVQLEATITGEGAVRSVRVLTAQVHPDLALAAADAVRQWKFEPTLLNGKPVEVVIKVTVDFRLKD